MRPLPVRAPKGGRLGSAQASREGVTEFSLQIPPRGHVSQRTGQALEPCLPPGCPSEAVGQRMTGVQSARHDRTGWALQTEVGERLCSGYPCLGWGRVHSGGQERMRGRGSVGTGVSTRPPSLSDFYPSPSLSPHHSSSPFGFFLTPLCIVVSSPL